MKAVFVSSTFRDMQAERDVLAMKVIPELNVYAREFGQSIRFVDLRWGVNTTDLDSDEGSQKVLKVCLDEIDNTRPYMIILIGERYGWIPPGEMIKSAADRKGYALQDFEKSVTELEIEYGALAEKGQLQNCLFYFRKPLLNIPENAREIYTEKDEKIENKLQALKRKIINSGALIKEYSCEWDRLNSKLIVPESFEKNIFDDVISLFERDFERLKNLAPQQREELSAQLFADQKAAQFAARYDLLNTCIEQIKNADTSLFILRGDPGSGKSTIMAKLFKTLSEEKMPSFLQAETAVFRKVHLIF